MDDPGSTISFFIVYVLLIVGSGYFSGTEISFATVNRIHMMSYASNGDRRAERVLKVLDNFDEALSVLLIGNNIVNIAFSTLTVVIAARILSNSTGAISVATLIATVIIFIFGEMLPKCFASSCNEKFAMAVSGSLLLLMKLLKPLSFLFTAISRAVTKPFVKRAEPEVTMTEDELHDIVESFTEDEDVDEDTGKLVKSALEFDDLTARDIMVPWENVKKIRVGMKNEGILRFIQNCVHSRLPVVSRDGSVRGILQIRRFLRAYFKNNHIVLASVLDYPYYVMADTVIDELLTQMSNHRRNLAIVKEKDGTIVGIITIEDILEQLVGEIYDEDDIGGDSDE